MGVTKENGKFRARYSKDGQRINVGSFKTRAQAEAAISKHRWDHGGVLTYEATGPIKPIIAKVEKTNTVGRMKTWLKALRTR